MSTPSNEPTPSPEPQPSVEPPPASEATPATSTSEGTLANVEPTEAEPGFVTRHTTTLITLMVAVIVAAVAIAGVVLYKNKVDDDNAATEAAFSQYIQSQNAQVDTVECNGDTCAAIIGGSAYSVLVQEDSKGKQHFGVSAFAGK